MRWSLPALIALLSVACSAPTSDVGADSSATEVSVDPSSAGDTSSGTKVSSGGTSDAEPGALAEGAASEVPDSGVDALLGVLSGKTARLAPALNEFSGVGRSKAIALGGLGFAQEDADSFVLCSNEDGFLSVTAGSVPCAEATWLHWFEPSFSSKGSTIDDFSYTYAGWDGSQEDWEFIEADFYQGRLNLLSEQIPLPADMMKMTGRNVGVIAQNSGFLFLTDVAAFTYPENDWCLVSFEISHTGLEGERPESRDFNLYGFHLWRFVDAYGESIESEPWTDYQILIKSGLSRVLTTRLEAACDQIDEVEIRYFGSSEMSSQSIGSFDFVDISYGLTFEEIGVG